MISFLIRRAVFSLVVLLVVSAAIFLLTRLVPGSPALMLLGPDASVEQIRQFEHQHGLDRPLLIQFMTWLGLMLIVYAAVQFRLFPPGGIVPLSSGFVPHLQSLVLPAFSLGIYYVAIVSRMTRSGMIEVLEQDYIRTARAMGFSEMRVLM